MELKKISERIYYLPHEKETDRPVLGFIKGDYYNLAIDAGNSAAHVKKFYKELEKANLSLPDYTILTHWHWDHTFGLHAVYGKTIAGHLTNKKLEEVSTWEWSDVKMKERLETGEDIEFCDNCIKIEYPDRHKITVTTAKVEFEGSLGIDLGGVHCIINEINAPHSKDSVLIYIPEEKTIFVGDADCEDHYENNGCYDKNLLKSYIEFIKDIDFSRYVIGHDIPQTKQEAMEYLNSELAKL